MSQCGSHFNTDQGTGSSEDNALDLTHRLRRGLIAHPNSGARKAGLTTEAQGACRGRLVSVNHVYKLNRLLQFHSKTKLILGVFLIGQNNSSPTCGSIGGK